MGLYLVGFSFSMSQCSTSCAFCDVRIPILPIVHTFYRDPVRAQHLFHIHHQQQSDNPLSPPCVLAGRRFRFSHSSPRIRFTCSQPVSCLLHPNSTRRWTVGILGFGGGDTRRSCQLVPAHKQAATGTHRDKQTSRPPKDATILTSLHLKMLFNC